MRSHTRQQQRRLLLFLLAALGVLVLASHHRASSAARAEPRLAPPPGPRLQQSAQDPATLSVDVWSLPPRPRAESKVRGAVAASACALPPTRLRWPAARLAMCASTSE